MSITIFNQLKFNRQDEFRKSLKDTQIEFFIPGVNSGVYYPATLAIKVLIKEFRPGFFHFTKYISHSNLSLTTTEFDLLFEEMRKIKELRDNVKR